MCLFIFQALLITLFAKNNYFIDSAFLRFYFFTVLPFYFLLFYNFTLLPFRAPTNLSQINALGI